ncbi:thiamine phosphate synthase [Kaistia algarum]|uniref:thiamine phosphate synthase n=1 Tax=Kaistia algarum TaxID=2083279 RepID=UPI000CE90D09|nr:thiamine phosphate synthase [Kaistia algarum]MCX5512486.1 thiamine phosphate synthase [Kaistia algarum]PPE77108.1 thiamine phosphate synthase [Kaistia algarum]
MRRPFDLSLYLITDEGLAGPRGVVETVRQAIDGGVTLVQLRDPENKTRHLIDTAAALIDILRPRGIPLIINDRVDVALAVDADGVHVGQSDMRTRTVRDLIGPDRIIGLSVSRVSELVAEDIDPVDYLGVGPIYFTSTKPNAPTPIGFDGVGAIRAASRLPIVVIGGVKAENGEAAIRSGSDGIAIVSAIMGTADPQAEAARLRSVVDAAKAG